MLLKFNFLVLLFISYKLSFCQDSCATIPTGKIEIICDERLNILEETRLNLNENKPIIQGYRVQIYFVSGNNSKKMANDIRTQFLVKYPDISAYIIYQAPNFKIRVGDFRTKLEANKFYNLIKNEFTSSFIVVDEINLSKL